MRRLLPVVALLGVAPLAAQQPLVSRTLDSATAVRLRLVDGPSVQGVLLAPLTPDASSILFAPQAHRPCSVPRVRCRLEVTVADVRAVEVRRGSQGERGALLGLAVGAAVGFALGVHLDASRPSCREVDIRSWFQQPWELDLCGGPSDGVVIPVSALLGGALGAGIGTLFGRGSPAWERAP